MVAAKKTALQAELTIFEKGSHTSSDPSLKLPQSPGALPGPAVAPTVVPESKDLKEELKKPAAAKMLTPAEAEALEQKRRMAAVIKATIQSEKEKKAKLAEKQVLHCCHL